MENTNQDKPVIALIVATYNCADTLDTCLDRYVSQTYENKRLIVIDGGSDDGTVEIIKAYWEYIDYWVSEPDKGIYDAWNKALRAPVDWDWVQFMGADDYYDDDNVLSEVARFVGGMPKNIMLVYGMTRMVYPDGSQDLIGTEIGSAPNVLTMPAGQVSLFYKKALFDLYGGFDSSYKILGDYEHYLRFFDKIEIIGIDGLISTVHQVGGVSTDPRYDLLNFMEKNRALSSKGFAISRNLNYYYVFFSKTVKSMLWRVFGDKVFYSIIGLVRSFSGGRKMRLELKVRGKD